MVTIPSGPIEGTPFGPLDLGQSVAGEEDPGASIDLAAAAGSTGRPQQAAGSQPPMSPGDQAPAGTPATGEVVCPRCGGSGTVDGGHCPECVGTGKVHVGIGGG